jgi:hypothetical protein
MGRIPEPGEARMSVRSVWQSARKVKQHPETWVPSSLKAMFGKSISF